MLSVFYVMDQRLYGNKILTWTHHHQVVYMEWRNLKLIMESYNLASPFTGGKSVNKDIAKWKFSLIWPCHKFCLIWSYMCINWLPISSHEWEFPRIFNNIAKEKFKPNLNFGYGSLMHTNYLIGFRAGFILTFRTWIWQNYNFLTPGVIFSAK